MSIQQLPPATSRAHLKEETAREAIAHHQQPLTASQLGELQTSDGWQSAITLWIWYLNRALNSTNDPLHMMERDFEGDIHRLWHLVIDTAKNTDRDDLAQDTLVRQILYIRELGAVTRHPNEENGGISSVSLNGQRIWSDLPYLAEDISKAWKEHCKFSVEQRTNFAAFIARLASVGVCGNALTVCALLLFKDALETPRPISQNLESNQVPVQDLLPALHSWMFFAPHKLIRLALESFSDFTVTDSAFGSLVEDESLPASGFDLEMWDIWERQLLQLINCGYQPVVDDATSLLHSMRIEGHQPL